MTTHFRRRKLALVGAFAALSLALPVTLQVAAEGTSSTDAVVTGKVQILRVATPSRAARNRLVRLGLDVSEHMGPGYLDVVAHDSGDRKTLKRAGFSWTVLVDDVEAAERARRTADKAYAASKPGGSSLPSGRTTYRTLANVEAELQSLAADYPTQARTFTLNNPSLEGRDVRALEVSNNVTADDGRPTLLITGVHHAREWPSAEMTLEFAYDLLLNSGNARIQDILDNVRVMFVPVVNPDGFQVSRGGAYEMKRKNCRITDGQIPATGACVLRINQSLGTDPNRNYGAKWGGPGASTSVDSEIYRGAGPFSEPETENIQQLVSSRQVVTLISQHTYGALVLRPPGTSVNGLAPDENLLRSLGDEMAAEMGYQSIYGYQLYDTTGTTEDWSYAATGGLGFTYELGTNGFHPVFKSIVPLYRGGTRKISGGGIREALLLAAESSIDTARHSVIEGTAPAGTTLQLTKSFLTETWDGSTFTDTLDDAMVVPANGSWTWHVNPSTRPHVGADGGPETWTLTCGEQSLPVEVDRGQAVDVGALTC